MFFLYIWGFTHLTLNNSRVCVIFPQNPRQRRTILQTKALGNQNTLDPKMKTYLGFGLPLILLLLLLLPLVFSLLFLSHVFALAKNETMNFVVCLNTPFLYFLILHIAIKSFTLFNFANQLVLILLWPISTPFMILISLMEITILSLF